MPKVLHESPCEITASLWRSTRPRGGHSHRARWARGRDAAAAGVLWLDGRGDGWVRWCTVGDGGLSTPLREAQPETRRGEELAPP